MFIPRKKTQIKLHVKFYHLIRELLSDFIFLLTYPTLVKDYLIALKVNKSVLNLYSSMLLALMKPKNTLSHKFFDVLPPKISITFAIAV